MKNNETITRNDLKRLLSYDMDSGTFRWRKDGNNQVKRGDVAGMINHDGYRRIYICGRFYMAHRLAWLYVYGKFPENEIDHINKKPSDNRIKNLRELSHSKNSKNRKRPSNNISGCMGVFYHKRDKIWEAKITYNKKQIYIGRYIDFEDAVYARLAAEQCLGYDKYNISSSAKECIDEF